MTINIPPSNISLEMLDKNQPNIGPPEVSTMATMTHSMTLETIVGIVLYCMFIDKVIKKKKLSNLKILLHSIRFYSGTRTVI